MWQSSFLRVFARAHTCMERMFAHTRMLKKYLLYTKYILGIALDNEETAVSKRKILSLEHLYPSGLDKMNMILCWMMIST